MIPKRIILERVVWEDLNLEVLVYPPPFRKLPAIRCFIDSGSEFWASRIRFSRSSQIFLLWVVISWLVFIPLMLGHLKKSH